MFSPSPNYCAKPKQMNGQKLTEQWSAQSIIEYNQTPEQIYFFMWNLTKEEFRPPLYPHLFLPSFSFAFSAETAATDSTGGEMSISSWKPSELRGISLESWQGDPFSNPTHPITYQATLATTIFYACSLFCKSSERGGFVSCDSINFCGYLPYSIQGTVLLSKPFSSLSEVSLAGTKFNFEAVSEMKARTIFSTSKVCKTRATRVFKEL